MKEVSFTELANQIYIKKCNDTKKINLLQVKEAATRYNNCDSDMRMDTIVRTSVKDRYRSADSYKQLQLFCAEYVAKKWSYFYDRRCCVSMTPNMWSGSYNSNLPQKICEYCIHKYGLSAIHKKDCTLHLENEVFYNQVWSLDNSCIDSVQYYNTNEHRTLCCKQCHFNVPPTNLFDSHVEVPCKRRSTDPFVVTSMESRPLRLCKRLSLQKHQNIPPVTDIDNLHEEDIYPANFTGLKCRTNRSVNFYLMDSLHHGLFAEQLGINLQSSSLIPSVILFDKQVGTPELKFI